MRRNPAATAALLVAILLVALAVGAVASAVGRGCPYTPLGSTLGAAVACDWWDSTCRRCT